MASVLDVAQYILSRRGPMTAMKLQKLVYYCQAWSVVWDEDCLFNEPIEAWANGPVVRSLWESHRGQFRVYGVGGNPDNLSAPQRETIDKVLAFYGDKNAQWLSDLTHMEDPWKNARAEGVDAEIRLDRMAEYYSSLPPLVAKE